ncbi:hypothetical protein ACQ27_gp282 [Klebsiella phage K64-1]|uniref:hypothetical protein n=1 Tax=Klebsiella phage K64-1 TaxID=1439894 RepID=UPI00248B7ECA|nr:hypothetical protein ACQ27_gp282 [Klebsiella phage K64-1]
MNSQTSQHYGLPLYLFELSHYYIFLLLYLAYPIRLYVYPPNPHPANDVSCQYCPSSHLLIRISTDIR